MFINLKKNKINLKKLFFYFSCSPNRFHLRTGFPLKRFQTGFHESVSHHYTLTMALDSGCTT
ncbi:hypothetical protein BpHYR1_031806 [Brachionus plicatilis]|uniref:Uncharacterized protein n=1 Tax=Brachionus plicatilis TaxID=10195 RepID=A0A3M7PU33_BRAPC|nr:hypothetical protein BpHYR1_031806 [Brachionus plicatilis]